MAVQDDLNGSVELRDTHKAIINFWSAAEYTYRVLCEQIAAMDDAKAEVDLALCPDTIKADGQGVLDKCEALKTAVENNHGDFLNWTPPQG